MAKLESFLGDHIEGFFNKRFSSNLQPAELAKALSRELARKRRGAAAGHLVPNDYTLLLGETDYERLCSGRVLYDLRTSLERQVILEDCFMDGPLGIHLLKNPEAEGKGQLVVHSRFTDGTTAPEEAEEEKQHTIVLERSPFAEPLNLPPDYELASLTAVRGEDQDTFLTLGEKQIYIGRLDKNDFILTDANVSRMHAYIAYERHRHFLHDAGSTNGTRVNGRPIESICLQAGDEIEVGNTALLYEVL